MMNERQRVIAEALLRRRLRNLVRVDDNTYVDTTYVSHVEYQMFLDDKQLEGKFYQLDHWTRFQFPKGKGRQPIIGVRPEDAHAFCAWLTEHADSVLENWRYRLPDKGEFSKLRSARSYTAGMPTGYWVQDDQATTFENVINTSLGLSLDMLSHRHKNDLKLARDYMIDPILDLDPTFSNTIVALLKQTLERIQDQPLNLAHVLAFARYADLTINPFPLSIFGESLALIGERSCDINRILKFASEVNLEQVLDLANALDTKLLSSLNLLKAKVKAKEFDDFVKSLLDIDRLKSDLDEDFSENSTENFVSNANRSKLKRKLKLTPDWVREWENYSELERKSRFETALHNASDVASARQRSLAHLHLLARKDPLKFLRSLTRLIVITVATIWDITGHRSHRKALPKLLELYISLVVLEERISGKLSAFEGIRIVKERVDDQ
jgi:hypothetical protein